MPVQRSSEQRAGIERGRALVAVVAFLVYFARQLGDLLLLQIGERLGASLRHADTIARIGGDEFVVLTDIVASGDIRIIRDKLTQALAAPFQIGHTMLTVSASLGHARYPDDGNSMDALLACADQGMYHLKRARQAQAACTML